MNERGTALGTCASFASIFLAIGPLIGGFFSHYLSWRFIFGINLPLGLLCLYFINRFIPKDVPAQLDKKHDFDFLGLFIFSVGFSALVFALMEGESLHWTNPIIIALLIFSGVMIPSFILYELRCKNPLAELRLFYIRNFSAANIVLLCTQVVVMSLTFWAIWLQISLGFSPLFAGICLLPAGLPIIIMGRIGGKWLDHYGPKLPICVGSVIVLFGMLWLTFTAIFQNYWFAFFGFLAYGIGAPLIISPAIATVLVSSPMNYKGMGAGILNTMRQLGAALCFAIVGTVINSVYLSHQHLDLTLKIGYSQAFAYGMAVTSVFAFIACCVAVFFLNNRLKEAKIT